MLLLIIAINIFTILLLICLISNTTEKINNAKETFSQGWGTSFGNFYPPQLSCNPETNCFVGLPMRNKIYANMCEPSIRMIDGHQIGSNYHSSHRILKAPRQLNENCYRQY